ncbi:MAG: type II toxin-antitoxin system VapC family toxin [Methylocystis sp.]|nr:type II toxin-antitoxin system VapC family toxin [Methylocystis sp.]
MRYLLDTNAVIGLLRDADSPLARRLRECSPADICLSSIVTHELYFGAYKSVRADANLKRLDALRFEVLPFDKEDSIAAGEIRAKLRAIGTPIGSFDLLIAGQALCRGLVLVTANVREFRRIDGLQIEDWTKAQ